MGSRRDKHVAEQRAQLRPQKGGKTGSKTVNVVDGWIRRKVLIYDLPLWAMNFKV